MASIIRRTYRVRTADGRVITRKCRAYTIEYTDPTTRRRKRHKGYTDLGATRQLAARLEKSVALGAEGLIDPFAESKDRPILEHVKEYLADLRAVGRDPMYVYSMGKRLEILREGCEWKTLADVSADSFIAWRERQRTSDAKGCGRDGKAPSAVTLNQYLESAVAFLNWCASTRRIEGFPQRRRLVSPILATVAKVEGAQKRPRRALSDEQVAALLAVAPKSRQLVYRVALATGLRRQELADLLWGDVRLAAIPAYIQLRAEATKARRGDALPLAATLAEELRRVKPKRAKDSDRVFAEVPGIQAWRQDLAAAKIPWEDAMGRRADFHGGTRKTLNTRMGRAGVPLTTAMRIMRHTDPKLTAIDYTDDALLDTTRAMEAVPELLPVPKGQSQAKAGRGAG